MSCLIGLKSMRAFGALCQLHVNCDRRVSGFLEQNNDHWIDPVRHLFKVVVGQQLISVLKLLTVSNLGLSLSW
jgi:hypothetical protein